MLDDRCVVGQVIVSVRLPDSDGQADRLDGLSYRWSGSNGWSDGLGKMVDVWSDEDEQSDRWGKMVYKWSDIDVWSDGLIAGWMGGVTDACVNVEWM